MFCFHEWKCVTEIFFHMRHYLVLFYESVTSNTNLQIPYSVDEWQDFLLPSFINRIRNKEPILLDNREETMTKMSPLRNSCRKNSRFQTGNLRRQPLLAILALSSSLFLSSVAFLSTSASSSMKNIVVVGGGVQGTSVAYQLAKKSSSPLKITILESKEPASAASGKGGGFMARSWGDGSPTQGLHHLAFDMYEDLAKELGCESYRKLPVLSVAPEGGGGIKQNKKNPLIPNWLDGKSIGRIAPMGYGDDTAQITPKEFVEKMIEAEDISVVLGTCTGVVVDEESGDEDSKVTGVKFQPRGSDSDEEILDADAVVVSAGPWSCQAEDWFEGSGVQLPMEGVKSTSIVWKQPEGEEVDATALFCGEDYRFNTHRKS